MPSATPASASAASTTRVAAAIGSATASRRRALRRRAASRSVDRERAEAGLPLRGAQEAGVDRVELGLHRDDAHAGHVGDRAADALDIERAARRRLQVHQRAPRPCSAAGQQQRIERRAEAVPASARAVDRRLRARGLDVGDEGREARGRDVAAGRRFLRGAPASGAASGSAARRRACVAADGSSRAGES